MIVSRVFVFSIFFAATTASIEIQDALSDRQRGSAIQLEKTVDPTSCVAPIHHTLALSPSPVRGGRYTIARVYLFSFVSWLLRRTEIAARFLRIKYTRTLPTLVKTAAPQNLRALLQEVNARRPHIIIVIESQIMHINRFTAVLCGERNV